MSFCDYFYEISEDIYNDMNADGYLNFRYGRTNIESIKSKPSLLMYPDTGRIEPPTNMGAYSADSKEYQRIGEAHTNLIAELHCNSYAECVYYLERFYQAIHKPLFDGYTLSYEPAVSFEFDTTNQKLSSGQLLRITLEVITVITTEPTLMYQVDSESLFTTMVGSDGYCGQL